MASLRAAVGHERETYSLPPSLSIARPRPIVQHVAAQLSPQRSDNPTLSESPKKTIHPAAPSAAVPSLSGVLPQPPADPRPWAVRHGPVPVTPWSHDR